MIRRCGVPFIPIADEQQYKSARDKIHWLNDNDPHSSELGELLEAVLHWETMRQDKRELH